MAVYITSNGSSLSQWLNNYNFVASYQGDYSDLYTTIGGGESSALTKPTTIFTSLTDLNNRKFNLTGGTVSGVTNFNAVVNHTQQINGTSVSLSGNLTIATTKFTVDSVTGNTHSDGVLDIDGTGNNAFAGSMDVTGNFAINVNKFSVIAASGNTTAAGDLTVNGGNIKSSATTFNIFPDTVTALNLGFGSTTVTSNGNFAIATNKTFSQSGTGTFSTGTGAVSLNGATSVTGTNTFTVGTGASTLGGALTVSGLTTLNGGITADSGVFSVADTTGDTNTGSNLTLQHVSNIITIKGNTGASTVNIFNGISTIVNAFGAATDINIGAATGDFNVKNATATFDGDIIVNGGDVYSSTITTGVINSFSNSAFTGTLNLGRYSDVTLGGDAKTVTVNNNLSVLGNTILGNASSDQLTINSQAILVPNSITFTLDDSNVSGVGYPLRVSHTITGTSGFANGIGSGIDFATETGNGVTKIGGTVEVVTTDITSASEDFDFIFKTMIAGAAASQVGRFNNAYLQVGAANTNTVITTLGTSNLTISTNAGSNSGTILINQGINGNIEITPNGTGDVYLNADTVRVGDTNAISYITTNGTGDLVLNTNSGTNSGTITIGNGTNGNITIEPNGTGDVYLNSDTVRIGDVNTATTLTTNGTAALTVTTGGAADTVISTNGGTNSGTITIANGANSNITIEPNGTGDVYLNTDTVRVGDANVDAVVSTNGLSDLILSTNMGTNSGSIRIYDGVNGNIDILTNGAGLINVNSVAVIGTKSTTNPTANTTNISPALPKATYKVVELTISAVDGTNTKVSKILVAHNGTTVDFTEYGIASVGTISPSYSVTLGTTNIEVTTDTTSATTTYKVVAVAL